MGSLKPNQQPSGSTRNVTEVFLFLRNNAQQDRFTMRTFSEIDDKMSLVTFDKENESVLVLHKPPSWINIVDEINYEFTRIKGRYANLKALQNTHEQLDFSDNQPANQEKIKDLTEEMTSMFSHSKRLIRLLEEADNEISQTLSRLRQNVINSLILTFNHFINEFRVSQTNYLKQLDSRISSINNFLVASTSDAQDMIAFPDGQEEMTIDQIQQIIANEQMTKGREREIVKISKSILDLNAMFKDISSMVLDQGTLLDRIDYNVEQSSMKVKSAYRSVEKAEKYQKHRKMHLIVILSAIALFLIFLILFTKL